MLNINPGHNPGLLDTCKTLGDYSEYTHRVRAYAKEMRIEDAVERAITECIRDNILADFLRKYRAEAKKVSIYEYDEEKHMRQTREEGYEEGVSVGTAAGMAAGEGKWNTYTDRRVYTAWIELKRNIPFQKKSSLNIWGNIGSRII